MSHPTPQAVSQRSQLTIRTDHDVLQWILTVTNVTGKLARWRVRLSEVDFEFFHWILVKHQAADALYRLRTMYLYY